MQTNFVPAYLPLLTEKARYKILFGGRGSGKSFGVADSLLFKGTKAKQNILCTREIQSSIDDSVHALINERINELGFVGWSVFNNAIKCQITDTKMIFKGLHRETAQSLKSIPNIGIAWIEEAQSISTESLEVLIPTIRNEGSEIWATMNRQKEDDAVYNIVKTRATSEKRLKYTDPITGREYFWTRYDGDGLIAIKANWDANPFFPEVLNKERLTMLENDPDLYLHVWEGEPISQLDNAILTRTSVRSAIGRDVSTDGQMVVGVDVARSGKDRTTFYKRKGLKIIASKEKANRSPNQKMLITQTADDLCEFVDYDKRVQINIDDTGVGGGLTDVMQSKGYNAVGVNFAQSAKDKDKFPNAISEMWFEFKSIIGDISIPEDSELVGELTERGWSFDNKGRRRVESKDVYKARAGKSPDKADALLLCFYNPVKYISNKPLQLVGI